MGPTTRCKRYRNPLSPAGIRHTDAALAVLLALFAPGGAAAQESGEPNLLPTAQEGTKAVQEAYQLSRNAKTEEEYSEIIRLCDRGLKAIDNEENAAYTRQLMSWAYNRRGELRAADGRDDDALSDFDQAVQLDPKRWQAWHNRGVSRAMLGRFEEALADLDKTIELNPNYPNAWFNRGELRYEEGRFAEAIEDYNRAIRLNSNDSPAYNSRGHAYYRQGNYRAAIEDYSQAIRLDAANAAAYTNRGDAYADLGQFAQAARDYRAAIRIDPNLGRAYQSAAWLMATCPDEQYRNARLAIDAATKAIELDGDEDYRYLDTLAAALANAGEFQQAVELQEQVVAEAPEDVLPRYEERLSLYRDNRPYRDVLDEAQAVSGAGANGGTNTTGRRPQGRSPRPR